MTIQITKTKSVEWTPPWEKLAAQAALAKDVVGIELESGHSEGCPAVRLQRRHDSLQVVAVGYVPNPETGLPTGWDDLGNMSRWSLPSAFRADQAALSINSVDSVTRQTAAAPFLDDPEHFSEGVPSSKDGVRSVFCKMSDESSVIQATLPEYQALWLSRLLPQGHRPAATSVQTAPCSLLASLAAQPGFCENGDEAAVFVTQSTIYLAGFRGGIPLLFRECPGSAGAAAMRETVKTSLGIDDTMLSAVFASNGIIDTRPALAPMLTPVISQIDISLDYLKSRLGANLSRIYLMGDAAGCNALKHTLEGKIALPIVLPNPFDGLEMPARSTAWKDQYCVGEVPQKFLVALGAALAVFKEAK